MSLPRTVAVIGASGYSGGELLRLLAPREDLSIVSVTAQSSAGRRVEDLHPDLAGVIDRRFDEDLPAHAGPVDLAFLALPAGHAMEIVPRLRDRVGHIIDLSGDFRLPSAAQYERYYGRAHTATDLLSEAVYGLPEVNRDSIAGARLVANPGCYATAVILALMPALRAGIIEGDDIVVNALSGASGAGRSVSPELSFSEVYDTVRAYRPVVHQHVPEIEHVLASAAGIPPAISFVPHLLPLRRGIYVTASVRLTRTVESGEVRALYGEAYAAAPFVRLREELPQMQAVRRTNFCDLGIVLDHRARRLILFATIDNLLKGAAGQAVQNMNIIWGLPETCGLPGAPRIRSSRTPTEEGIHV